MSSDVSICQVCLRMDRKLEFFEVQLAIFYSELIGKPVQFPTEYQAQQFCSECGHLLRRFYNFRNKCRRAHKIMFDWKKKRRYKPPLETLYDHLPNAMGVWNAINNTIFSFNYSQDTAMNYPALTNDAINTPALGGNQNLLRFIVPVITPMSQLTNVPTDNTENIDPIKLEKGDNIVNDFDVQDIQIQDVKSQSVSNINKSIEADTVTIAEMNELEVKLENDCVDSTDNEVQHDPSIKDVFKEEDNDKFLNVDGPKSSNLNIKDLDDIDNVSSDCDIDQENTKRSDDTMVDDDIEAIYLTYETDDFRDTVNDDKNDDNDEDNDDSTDGDDASDNRRLDIITTKLSQFKGDLVDICEIYKKLLSVKNIFDSKQIPVKKNLTPIRINLLLTNFDFVIRNNENTLNILKGNTIILKEYTKNIVLDIINEADASSPEGSGIDKEFISQCILEKEPMDNVKNILRILNCKSTTDVDKKRQIIERAKKLETSYKNSKWDDLSEIFDIDYLNTDRKAREEFERRKTYRSYIKSKFKCEICYLPYNSARLLASHMVHHDKKVGKFSCKLCKTYYAYQRKLSTHNAMQHKKVFRCKLCPAIILVESSAIGHRNYHKGIKIECELCDEKFTWKALYYAHRANVHGRNFICTVCAIGFPTEKKLEEHKKIHEKRMARKPLGADNPGVKCDDCGLVFISKKICERHIQNAHTNTFTRSLYYSSVRAPSAPRKKRVEKVSQLLDYYNVTSQTTYDSRQVSQTTKVFKDSENDELSQPVMCEHCGLLFTTAKGIAKHLRCHEGVYTRSNYYSEKHTKKKDLDNEEPSQPLMCEHCGLQFSTEMGMSQHLRSHKGLRKRKMNIVECRVCGVTCPLRYNLGVHFEKEHPELDIDVVYADRKPFLCDKENCGKRFQHLWMLRDHILTHSNVKPFACTECPKRYYTRDQLLRHGIYHLPKSKECDVCGKMFRTASNLFSHKRYHTHNRKYKCGQCGKGFFHRAAAKEHIRGVHHGIRRARKPRTKKTDTESGNDDFDTENVDIATGNEITTTGNIDTETGNETIAAVYEIITTGNTDAEAGNDVTRHRRRILCKRGVKVEGLKVFGTTSKRMRKEAISEAEDTD